MSQILADKLFKIHSSAKLSVQSLYFIYTMMRDGEYTDEDIEMYSAYEANGDKDIEKKITEVMHSCKVYISKCRLLGKDCADPSLIVFEEFEEPGRMNKKLIIRDMTPVEISQASAAVADDDLDDDDDPDDATP